MLRAIKNIFKKKSEPEKIVRVVDLTCKNRSRFESIISDERFNFLESIYTRLFAQDLNLTDIEILEAYYKFSDRIQTNTFAAGELEWVSISVLCHFRQHLTESLIRRGLLCIVYSLGDDIDWFTVGQFIEKRILAQDVEPYGGLPPEEGQEWLKNLLPSQKELVQAILLDVIEENRRELENL